MDIPAGWAMVFLNKSGIATKYGLIVGAQVVDHGYQGEIHINVINTNNENPVYIDEGDKLVQGVLIPVGLHPLVEVPLEEMFLDDEMIPGTRGDGGFGHTGMDVLATEPSEKEKQDEEWKNEISPVLIQPWALEWPIMEQYILYLIYRCCFAL